MTLVQAMRADVPSLGEEASLKEAATQMRQAKCLLALVVSERGRLIGSLSIEDLAHRLANSPDPSRRTIRAAVRTDPLCCTIEASLEEVQALMSSHRELAVLVTEPGGAVVGVIDVLGVLDALGPPQRAAGPEPDYVHRVRGDA